MKVTLTLLRVLAVKDDDVERAPHALMAAYGQTGDPISRAPLAFQEEGMPRLETFPDVCTPIKRPLDPNGVLSPGRYGIG